MSTKDLMYIEDVLGHAQYFTAQCRETAGKLQDGELKSYVERMIEKNSTVYASLYGLL